MASEWIPITPNVSIRVDEIAWRFSGSGGPGGQHANTANTRAEAIFSIESSTSLPERERARLLERLGPTLRVVADDERSQRRNRELALERLAERLRRALEPRKRRIGTRPTKTSVQRRLDEKRRVAERKRDRSGREDE